MRTNYVLLVVVFVDRPTDFYLIPTSYMIISAIRESENKPILTAHLLNLLTTDEAQACKRTPPIHMQPGDYISDIYYF